MTVGENGRVVSIVVDSDHFCLSVDLERVAANRHEFKVKPLLHEDLIEVDRTTFAIDDNRLSETRGFTNCNAPGLNEVYLGALIHRGLNDLTMAEVVESQKHNDIVYELLITVLENGVKIRQEIAEKQLDELILELGRQLFVEAVLFHDHVMIAPE